MSLLLVAVFSFAAANAANLINSIHATPLIAHYVQSHSVMIKRVKQTEEPIMKELNQLSKLSNSVIETKINNEQPVQATLPNIYPVVSTLLSPGELPSRHINVALPTPLFIVGDDTLSKSWMLKYKDKLIQIRARGFVVNVETQTDMRALKRQFPQLQLMPMLGNAFAKWLKIRHYPVLISDKLIEQ